jgi:galactose mutarotase-like enzyme
MAALFVSIRVPDRKGQVADIVLGHETLDGYIPNPPYIGAVVGRYANRIANGTFTLDGKTYTLPKNDGPNTLHGGVDKTFNKVVWEGEALKGKTGVAFMPISARTATKASPAIVKVKVTYTLTDNNELLIDYEATTDKATPINLSQHSYFNLAGEGNGDILNHELMLNADRFTPVDKNLIPTGELRPVKGTPLDFTTTTKSGRAHRRRLRPARAGPRLRPQLGHQPEGRRAHAGGTHVRAHERARAGSRDDAAGRAVLYRKFSRRHASRANTATCISAAIGLCLETQHFPGFTEPSGLSEHDSEAGRDVQVGRRCSSSRRCRVGFGASSMASARNVNGGGRNGHGNSCPAELRPYLGEPASATTAASGISSVPALPRCPDRRYAGAQINVGLRARRCSSANVTPLACIAA